MYDKNNRIVITDCDVVCAGGAGFRIDFLARQIRILLDEPKRRKEQIANGKLAVQAYRWEEVVAPIETFLQHQRTSSTRITSPPAGGLPDFFKRLKKVRWFR